MTLGVGSEAFAERGPRCGRLKKANLGKSEAAMTISRWIARFIGVTALSLAVGTAASAQYPGGMGGNPGTGPGGTYVPPKNGYSSGKAIGIGVGVAAAVGVTAALVIHHRHVVARRTEAYLTGCTESVQNGIALTNEKDSQVYLLEDNNSIKAGQRVMVKGVAANDRAGNPAFQVRSVVKEYGSCGTTAARVAAAVASSTGH